MTIPEESSAASQLGLRVLITNNTLAERAGSELFVRDLCRGLAQRGHRPVAFSPVLGDVADELRALSVPVLDDLADLAEPPDVVHGQHHLPALAAFSRYPDVPAVLVCHGWSPWEEQPVAFPSVRRYVAVDDLCKERLLTTPGIDPRRIEVLRNFVDLERFLPRHPLPERPRRALVFSNAATTENFGGVIADACRDSGIEVDLIGLRSGNAAAAPESLLGDYDIVFAKGRAALEALATGCAVVVADAAGLGGMVTAGTYDGFRALNMGLRTLARHPVRHDTVSAELRRYDPSDASIVSARVRREASSEDAVDRWVALYRAVAREAIPDPAADPLTDVSRYLSWLATTITHQRRSIHDLHTIATESRDQADRVSAQLAGTRAALAEAVESTRARDIELAEVRAERDRLSGRLAAVRSSRLYRLARPVWRVRARWGLPRDSDGGGSAQTTP